MRPSIEDEFRSYQTDILDHPKADVTDVVLPTVIYKLHKDGERIFGCLLSHEGKFLQYLPKIALN